MTARRVLRQGNTGEQVRTLQSRLKVHGYVNLVVDGDFGKNTRAAVIAFQKRKRLTPDGIVGPATWAELAKAPPPTKAQLEAEAKKHLTAMGWRTDTPTRYTTALKSFQEACCLPGHSNLTVDGIAGPKSLAALCEAVRLGGKLSPNFKASEFRCKCEGSNPACKRIWPVKEVVLGAEKLRTLYGPFTPISACRCPAHNTKVGGVSNSQHKFGTAMDIHARFSIEKIVALRHFTAIGHNSNGTVRHVDIRNAGAYNLPPAGTTSSPRLWRY